ncbi:GerAB/ArcD/ProY family transporter [Evansella tamaricis]|uniref:Spore germination protein n=1 Tax=Evansella tamaricis TaxID=2069301 RepID=A0ABS6JG41_9BACI|nr:endospore germination permease [Evansella tamaricis]MBU9712596.1 spore germination protein [Evansella tamaricis]
MDTGKFKKLNKYHVIFLVHCSLSGIALFSLPYYLRHVGYNMWMVLLIYGVLSSLLLKVILQLSKQFPNDTFYVIMEKVVGKYVSKLLHVFILSYAIVQVSNIGKSYVRIVQSVTLPDFTITFPALTLFLVMISIVNGGIKSIARFCILSFFLTVWMGYYSNWAFSDANVHHLYPRLHEYHMIDWLNGLFEGSQIMLGFVLIVFFYPYIIDQKKAFKHAAIGIWSGIGIMILICIASIVYFSIWQIEHLLYPLLNLFQAVELSNVERIETMGISLYAFLVLSKASLYLWVAKKGLDALFSKHKNRTRHLFIVNGISVLLVLGPIPLIYQTFLYEKWVIYWGYAVILLPLFLLIINHWKKRKKGNDGKEASAS